MIRGAGTWGLHVDHRVVEVVALSDAQDADQAHSGDEQNTHADGQFHSGLIDRNRSDSIHVEDKAGSVERSFRGNEVAKGVADFSFAIIGIELVLAVQFAIAIVLCIVLVIY